MSGQSGYQTDGWRLRALIIVYSLMCFSNTPLYFTHSFSRSISKMDFKRPLAGVATMSMVPLPTKKARYDTSDRSLTPFIGGSNRTQLVTAGRPGSLPRTSRLMSPNMLLQGHDSEIYCCKFSSDGSFAATAGFDRQIMLWDTYGECENIASLSGIANHFALGVIFVSCNQFFLYFLFMCET